MDKIKDFEYELKLCINKKLYDKKFISKSLYTQAMDLLIKKQMNKKTARRLMSITPKYSGALKCKYHKIFIYFFSLL